MKNPRYISTKFLQTQSSSSNQASHQQTQQGMPSTLHSLNQSVATTKKPKYFRLSTTSSQLQANPLISSRSSQITNIGVEVDSSNPTQVSPSHRKYSHDTGESRLSRSRSYLGDSYQNQRQTFIIKSEFPYQRNSSHSPHNTSDLRHMETWNSSSNGATSRNLTNVKSNVFSQNINLSNMFGSSNSNYIHINSALKKISSAQIRGKENQYLLPNTFQTNTSGKFNSSVQLQQKPLQSHLRVPSLTNDRTTQSGNSSLNLVENIIEGIIFSKGSATNHEEQQDPAQINQASTSQLQGSQSKKVSPVYQEQGGNQNEEIESIRHENNFLKMKIDELNNEKTKLEGEIMNNVTSCLHWQEQYSKQKNSLEQLEKDFSNYQNNLIGLIFDCFETILTTKSCVQIVDQQNISSCFKLEVYELYLETIFKKSTELTERLNPYVADFDISTQLTEFGLQIRSSFHSELEDRLIKISQMQKSLSLEMAEAYEREQGDGQQHSPQAIEKISRAISTSQNQMNSLQLSNPNQLDHQNFRSFLASLSQNQTIQQWQKAKQQSKLKRVGENNSNNNQNNNNAQKNSLEYSSQFSQDQSVSVESSKQIEQPKTGNNMSYVIDRIHNSDNLTITTTQANGSNNMIQAVEKEKDNTRPYLPNLTDQLAFQKVFTSTHPNPFDQFSQASSTANKVQIEFEQDHIEEPEKKCEQNQGQFKNNQLNIAANLASELPEKHHPMIISDFATSPNVQSFQNLPFSSKFKQRLNDSQDNLNPITSNSQKREKSERSPKIFESSLNYSKGSSNFSKNTQDIKNKGNNHQDNDENKSKRSFSQNQKVSSKGGIITNDLSISRGKVNILQLDGSENQIQTRDENSRVRMEKSGQAKDYVNEERTGDQISLSQPSIKSNIHKNGISAISTESGSHMQCFLANISTKDEQFDNMTMKTNLISQSSPQQNRSINIPSIEAGTLTLNQNNLLKEVNEGTKPKEQDDSYFLYGDKYVIATFPFKAQKENDLEFQKGDKIILLKCTENGWWIGICNNKIGYFPFNFVSEIQ